MTTQKATAKTVVINLSDVSRLRELNKADRTVQRETKAKPTITVSGTFPIAKYWNDAELKKVAYPDGLAVTNAVVEDIRVKWIIAYDGDTKVFLKNEGAAGAVTMTTIATA